MSVSPDMNVAAASKRALRAFFIAPLIPNCIFIGLAVVFGIVHAFQHPENLGDLGTDIGSACVALIFIGIATIVFLEACALPAMVFFGIPAYLILQRLHYTGRAIYAGAGAIIGMVLAYIIAFLGDLVSLSPSCRKPWSQITNHCLSHHHMPLGEWLFGAFYGAIIALVFWLVARPDRAASLTHPSQSS